MNTAADAAPGVEVSAEDEERIAQEAYLAEMAGTDSDDELETKTPEPEIVDGDVDEDSSNEVEGSVEDTAEPEVETEAEAEPEPERVEILAGYTAEELKEALELIPKLRKSIDTANGTYGTKLERLNAAIAELTAKQAETGEMPPIDLDELNEDFPELGASISKGLNAWMGKIKVAREGSSQKTQDTSAWDAKMQEADARLKKQEMRLEATILEVQHPDWRNTATYTPNEKGFVVWDNPDFGAWAARQGSDVQEELVSTDSAAVLSKYLSKYKADTKPATPKTTTKSRTAVLSNAVAPKNAPAANSRPKTDDQIAHEAFLAEMRS